MVDEIMVVVDSHNTEDISLLHGQFHHVAAALLLFSVSRSYNSLEWVFLRFLRVWTWGLPVKSISRR
jgi:hypothetical protein